MIAWESKGDYSWIAEMPRKACAWEFLRRNPAYREAWSQAQSAQRIVEHASGVNVVEIGDNTASRQWGLLGPLEDPDRNARQANVFWSPKADTSVLPAFSVHASGDGVHGLLPLTACNCRTLVYIEKGGVEHVLFSRDGRSLQLEVGGNSVFSPGRLLPDILSCTTENDQAQSVRQLIDLAKHRDLRSRFYPPHRQGRRLIEVLQALDGELAGASRREIAVAMFGEDNVRREWRTRSMHDKIRNAVLRGMVLLNGGYKTFLK